MKPFMGVDRTQSNKNTFRHGNEFLVATPSPALSQALETALGKAQSTLQKATLPLILRILQVICAIVGFGVFIGILRGLGGASIQQAYENAGWAFWVGGSCLLVWLILLLVEKQQKKRIFSAEESQRILQNIESIEQSIFRELTLPEGTRDVDILTFHYKVKNDSILPVAAGNVLTAYENPVFKVYADEENFYLVNVAGKFAFPRSGLRTIRTVKGRVTITNWHKALGPKEGFYQEYKLTVDNNQHIHSKHFHILELEYVGEIWGIWFPCYELPVFERLTERKAEPIK